MDKVEVKLHKTKYAQEEHLMIFVNDLPLDLIISELFNNSSFIGLVPSLLDWDLLEVEKKLITKRAQVREGSVIFPVLLCPDDFDLWCTKIIVEIHFKDNYVIWKRIGVDNTPAELLIDSIGNVGVVTQWLEQSIGFEFENDNYEHEFRKFKNHNTVT